MVSLSSLPKRQIVITMAGVMLAMFLSSLDQTIVGTAMPKIIVDLGGFTHYTWVTTAYLITSTVAVPITGKLTDMYGRKYFYIAGIAVFTLGSLLSGLSQTMLQIILFRALQGIGAGVMIANAFTVIGDLFPPAERGKYVGLMSGVFGLSAVVGPTLGGYITDAISWHWVFFVNVPLGVLVITLFVFFFPHIRPDGRHQIDYLGVTTLILAVIPLLLALSWGGVDYEWSSPLIVGLLVFSALMTFSFIMVERHSPEPIIPLSLFRNQIVTISQVVIFLTGFGMFGGIIFIPLFFQGVLGLSATMSGSFLTPMTLAMVVGSLVSGQLLSRAGGHYRLIGAVGIAIMATGTALLSRMTMSTSYASAAVSIVLTGLGLGITMPLYTIAVQNAVPYSFLGIATSSTAFFRSIGGSVGLAVFGSVMNNRFASEFSLSLPGAVKSAIPPDQLSLLVHNPQLLFSPEAQSQFVAVFERLPQGGALLNQTVLALRQSLNTALSQVFLLGLVAVLLALAVHLFIQEIPLRKQHGPDSPGEK
ncbi:MAG: MDR family MFS transporter [Chloroflexota bacterium]